MPFFYFSFFYCYCLFLITPLPSFTLFNWGIIAQFFCCRCCFSCLPSQRPVDLSDVFIVTKAVMSWWKSFHLVIFEIVFKPVATPKRIVFNSLQYFSEPLLIASILHDFLCVQGLGFSINHSKNNWVVHSCPLGLCWFLRQASNHSRQIESASIGVAVWVLPI